MNAEQVYELLTTSLDGFANPRELQDHALKLRTLVSHVQTLASYSETKARAMINRAAGICPAALTDEKICDYLHESLPEWMRW